MLVRMSFEFSINKSVVPSEATIDTESFDVEAEKARWAVEYEREWQLIKSYLAQKGYTFEKTDPEFFIKRISMLLSGLKRNPDGVAPEERIKNAINDLLENERGDNEQKAAA